RVSEAANYLPSYLHTFIPPYLRTFSRFRADFIIHRETQNAKYTPVCPGALPAYNGCNIPQAHG
ncbi:MAG TPA: hypothetical protein PLJ24_04595, partial [Anaerolineae bacterium]|nr:hypothetical protein [Anaerolineae bacterium]